jgi:rubrerythrin
MDFRFEYPHLAPVTNNEQFLGDTDLIFLREDIADEIGAIVGYIECAGQIKDFKLNKQFWDIAEDESAHFTNLMSMLANFDPVQAEKFKKQGLLMITGLKEASVSMGVPGRCQSCSQPEHHRRDYGSDKRLFIPDERVLECLRNAVKDELYAINAYQKQIAATKNSSIQNLLFNIMNNEKEHVSLFTKLFYELNQV